MNSTLEIESHKVYPKTYLVRVIFSISYEKLANECYSALAQFIHTAFGFDVTAELLDNLSNRSLCFGTEDHAVEWTVGDSSLSIVIAQEAYNSFDVSLLPLIGVVKEFLKVVDRKADEIFLNKVNLIPVTLSTYSDLKLNVDQVFTDSILNQWKEEVYQQNDNSLIYLIKRKGTHEENIDTFSGFISEGGVAAGQPSRYVLDISVRYEGQVDNDKFIDRIISMNDKLYEVFIESVTEELKKSMEEA